MLHSIIKKIKKIIFNSGRFISSSQYWEERYNNGENSGRGSYNHFAKFKAEVINDFISKNQILTVTEFGSGDGNQLTLYKIPSYIGVDVSSTIIKKCREKFEGDNTKSFYTLDEYKPQKTDLVMSIDVIYHLVENVTFESHIRSLFENTDKYVIIYSSNEEVYNPDIPHVKHRTFTDFIDINYPNFILKQHIKNKYAFKDGDERTTRANFYIYEKS